ncbi:MAG: cohesin domain-containing protein [Pyrinomonadaceae bacterium]
MPHKFSSLRPCLSSLFSFAVIAALCLMPTLRVTAQISGTVTYGNPPGSTKLLSNVSMDAVSTTVGCATNPASTLLGAYTLPLIGFTSGLNCVYTVTPSRINTGINGISSADCARIAQHTSNLVPLTSSNQMVGADVSGNGVISSFDAAQLAKFVSSGTPPFGLAGTWRFYTVSIVPFPPGATAMNRTYSDPASSGPITGQDYTALLVGEVTGNWTAPRPANGPERNTVVSLPRLVTPVANEVVVPVVIEGAANKGIISYEFNLRYDSSVIQPQENPVDVKGTASRGLMAVANPNEPGLLRVVMYGAMPISDDGVLLNLKFTAVGKPGSTSPLAWERIMFNEGEPQVNATGGQVDLF